MRHQNTYSTFVLFTVVTITLLSGCTSLLLAAKPELTDPQKRILDTTNNTWLMGTGAIFGLLGGGSVTTTKGGSDRDQDTN